VPRGWTFSSAMAALVFAAVRRQRGHRLRDLRGHGYFGSQPAVDGSDAWETPLGTTKIDDSFRQVLLDRGAVVADSSVHRHEHSIEVQVPFIQHLFPDARIVPIIVPASESALGLGKELRSLPPGLEEARLQARHRRSSSSTDLTHYGPRTASPRWESARRRCAGPARQRPAVPRPALSLEPRRLLANAAENNACGPGAAAAYTWPTARQEGHPARSYQQQRGHAPRDRDPVATASATRHRLL
jgi:AmmeMemoRadiSam system protein B